MSTTTTQINVGGSAIIGGDLKIGLRPTRDAENKILVMGDGNIVIPGSSLKGKLRSAVETLSEEKLAQELERANYELTLAYDATLEGWSRALDLRDKETEGHTERVTELAIRMAQAMGMSDEELIHVRRGALLHDIGKMGIPDEILTKSGPLTDDEWAVFRRHPENARDVLEPIPFLRPAIDIPYSYNERWDGTGFPRGLKGEEIPLAARIFAVADVYDALSSERHYRKALSHEKILEQLREQAGKMFDPDVVEVLVKVMEGNE